MAYLKMNTLEPVSFGGKECKPMVTTETKMRLAQIKLLDDSADEIIASAFPDDEEFVKDFLKGMPMFDKQILHAYLVGGPSMVEIVQKEINKIMEDSFKNV